MISKRVELGVFLLDFNLTVFMMDELKEGFTSSGGQDFDISLLGYFEG